jgi:hypothetical protein
MDPSVEGSIYMTLKEKERDDMQQQTEREMNIG